MLRIPRFGTKTRPVPAVDEGLLKLLIEDIWQLSHADFDFCVDCLTESAVWRQTLIRLAEEHHQSAAPQSLAVNH